MSDAGIASIVTGIVTITTIIAGFLTLWIKLRYGVLKAEEAATKAQVVETKIDNNTKITKEGVEAAANNAQAAADAANASAAKTDALSEQLNGKLEARITAIVKEYTEPLVVMFRVHSEQDDKNMMEIRRALGELRVRAK